MSSNQTSRKRACSGELRKIDCRVCQSTLNFQSYKDHLTAKHPEENSRDLRGHGQVALFFGGVGGAAAAAVPVRDTVVSGGHETESDTDIGDGKGEGVPVEDVEVEDNNREDLFSQDVHDVHQVKDAVPNPNEVDVEDSQDVIPNTDDVMKDINELDEVRMEDDSDIEGETVTVARLRREREMNFRILFLMSTKN